MTDRQSQASRTARVRAALEELPCDRRAPRNDLQSLAAMVRAGCGSGLYVWLRRAAYSPASAISTDIKARRSAAGAKAARHHSTGPFAAGERLIHALSDDRGRACRLMSRGS